MYSPTESPQTMSFEEVRRLPLSRPVVVITDDQAIQSDVHTKGKHRGSAHFSQVLYSQPCERNHQYRRSTRSGSNSKPMESLTSGSPPQPPCFAAQPLPREKPRASPTTCRSPGETPNVTTQRPLSPKHNQSSSTLPYLVDEVTPPTGRRAHIAKCTCRPLLILRTALRSAARNLKMAESIAVAFANNDGIDRGPHTLPALAGRKCQPARPRQALLRARQHYHDRNVRAFATSRDGCGSCTDALTDAQLAPLAQGSSMLADVSHGSCRNQGHLTEMRAALGTAYGCDDCQEVCPPTVRLAPQHEPGSGLGEWVDRSPCSR